MPPFILSAQIHLWLITSLVAADTAEQPDLASAFQGPEQPQKAHNSWLTWSVHALFVVLAFVGVCAAGFLAVELLPAGTTAPGILCTPHDAQACLAVHKAYWASEAGYRDLPRWRVLVKKVKWYMQDAWDSLVLHKLPAGVTEADLAYPLVARITEKQQQDMPIELAQQLFGDMSPAVIPPIIAARLEAAKLTPTAHKPPEDLVAVSGAQFVVPELEVEQERADVHPAAEQQHIAAEAANLIPSDAEVVMSAAADTAQQDPGAVVVELPTASAIGAAANVTDAEYAAAQMAVEDHGHSTVDADQLPSAAAAGQYDVPEAGSEPAEQELMLIADSTAQDNSATAGSQQGMSDSLEVAIAEDSPVSAEAATDQPAANTAIPQSDPRTASTAQDEAAELDAPTVVTPPLELDMTAEAQVDTAAPQPEGAAVPAAELDGVLDMQQPSEEPQLEVAAQPPMVASLAPEERDYSEPSPHPAVPLSKTMVKQASKKAAGFQYLVRVLKRSKAGSSCR